MKRIETPEDCRSKKTYDRQWLNWSKAGRLKREETRKRCPPKAKVTGSNPVGCAIFQLSVYVRLMAAATLTVLALSSPADLHR